MVLNNPPEHGFQGLINACKKKDIREGLSYNNLYIKIEDQIMIILVVYVDDIIFGSNLTILRRKFATKMQE
jgi:hypothetical protein